jgi:hypothetical protein
LSEKAELWGLLQFYLLLLIVENLFMIKFYLLIYYSNISQKIVYMS